MTNTKILHLPLRLLLHAHDENIKPKATRFCMREMPHLVEYEKCMTFY